MIDKVALVGCEKSVRVVRMRDIVECQKVAWEEHKRHCVED